jgi:hypothetical protein
MSKYASLEKYLRDQPWDEVPMTFDDIERVIGAKLPPAQRYRAWWSNNPSNNVMTKAWLSAGFRTERVDLAGRKLVFRRVETNERGSREGGMADAAAGFESGSGKPVKRHPLLGALKLTVTIEAGFDLSGPAMPEWAEVVDAKYGPEPHT